MTVRVVIADDHALLRASFRLLLGTTADIDVVGEAGTGVEAVAVVAATRPDVVLMDVRMPGGDGIEATGRITADPDLAGVRVLVLTTFGDDRYVFAALRHGASGFLLKDTTPAELVAAIRHVAAGDALLAPTVTRRLIAEFSGRTSESGRLRSLTDREREVLTLVARGLSNADIALRLYLSMATVKTHIGRLLAKLGARDRAQLVIAAYEAGVVAPGARAD